MAEPGPNRVMKRIIATVFPEPALPGMNGKLLGLAVLSVLSGCTAHKAATRPCLTCQEWVEHSYGVCVEHAYDAAPQLAYQILSAITAESKIGECRREREIQQRSCGAPVSWR